MKAENMERKQPDARTGVNRKTAKINGRKTWGRQRGRWADKKGADITEAQACRAYIHMPVSLPPDLRAARRAGQLKKAPLDRHRPPHKRKNE